MKFTCDRCPMRARCTVPCAAVESMLPNINKGAVAGFEHKDPLQAARRLHVMMQEARFFTDNRDRLAGRMRMVFDLTYNEGLSQREIAKLLGVHTRSVGFMLARARRKIARFASHRRGGMRRRRG